MKEIPEEIILRCQNGSAEAFAELVDRYEKPLFAYVYRMNCTTANLEPEDITQDIFLKVYKNMNNFKQLRGACFSPQNTHTILLWFRPPICHISHGFVTH